MNKIFTLLTFSLLVLTACSKKDAPAASVSTDFLLVHTGLYLNQEANLEVTSPTSGATYTWDFGDGNQQTGTSVSHAYTTAGYYTIKVTSGGQTSSHKLRIFPGTMSFQYKNSIGTPITSVSISVVNKYGQIATPYTNVAKIDAGGVTDTIFANVQYDTNEDLIRTYINCHIVENDGNDISFSTETFYMTPLHHQVFEINGSTGGQYLYQNNGQYYSGSATLSNILIIH